MMEIKLFRLRNILCCSDTDIAGDSYLLYRGNEPHPNSVQLLKPHLVVFFKRGEWLNMTLLCDSVFPSDSDNLLSILHQQESLMNPFFIH